MEQTPPPLLELRDVHKRFPGVYALKGVDFELYAGEVHALVGENGAGKSTLIKIIAGAYDCQRGTYLIEGQPAEIEHPLDAIKKGISVVYQELELMPYLSVAENVFFGRLPTHRGRVLWKQLYENTVELLEQIGLDIHPKTKVRHLGIAAQQLVEVARALSWNARVLVMDEPTSALSPSEIDRLSILIRRLQERGVGIVYISHKLEEIIAIANRVTVLRDGECIGTEQTTDMSEERLISMMVGRELTEIFPKTHTAKGGVVLEVDKLTTASVSEVSFQVRRGEIVGFAGLIGAGRTELTRAVFGTDRRASGKILVEGQPVPPHSPPAARRLGIGLVPEDRRSDGIFPHLSVGHNMSIVALRQFCHLGHIRQKQEAVRIGEMIDQLSIRTPTSQQSIAKLSGGNQQKVLIARWLMTEDLKVLFVDEPTRGIDVGVRVEIYRLLDELARKGLALVVMSSEFPEILGLCGRIYVMKGGRIAGEFNRQDATQEALLARAI